MDVSDLDPEERRLVTEMRRTYRSLKSVEKEALSAWTDTDAEGVLGLKRRHKELSDNWKRLRRKAPGFASKVVEELT